MVSRATSVVIAISEKRTSATTAKMTPGPANRVARRPPSKASAVSRTPTVAIAAPTACSGLSDLAAKDHRQHDRQATERRDHPADDRDRAELQAREVRQVGARADEPEQRREPERAVGRSAASSPVTRKIATNGHRGHRLHPGRHPQAADDPAAEGGNDVERAPEQGGRESGQESEGHRRSLAGRDRPRATIPARSPVRGRGATARGDVAQLEEHCVRIAGVRGSSPLISTIPSRPSVHASSASAPWSSAAWSCSQRRHRLVVGPARGDDVPEPRPVTEHPQVRELVDDDRLEGLGRRQDEPPREGQSTGARGAAPSRPLIADRHRGRADAEGGRMPTDLLIDGGPGARPEPRLEDGRDGRRSAGARWTINSSSSAPPMRSTDERRRPARAGTRRSRWRSPRNRIVAPSRRPPRAARIARSRAIRSRCRRSHGSRSARNAVMWRSGSDQPRRPAAGTVTTTPRSGWMTTRRPRDRGDRRSV